MLIFLHIFVLLCDIGSKRNEFGSGSKQCQISIDSSESGRCHFTATAHAQLYLECSVDVYLPEANTIRGVTTPERV